MLAKLAARFATVPRRTWIIVGIAAAVIAVVTAVLIILDPFAGPFEVLNAREPAVSHPDGLVASLNPGSRSASVQIKTIPREAFLADEAGGSWVEARAALPAGVTPLSPIYSIKVRGEGSVSAEMTFPNDAEPLELLDLFRWDEEARIWKFLPSTQDAGRQVITFIPERPVSHVLAVRAGGASIAAGIVISPGGPDLGPDYGLAIPEGIAINSDMSPAGEVVSASGSTVLPVISNSAPDSDMASELARTRIASGLRQIILDNDGVVLDLGDRPGLSEVVIAVAEEAHSHGKRLDVVVRGTSLDGYDLAVIGVSADRVWLAPGDNPNLYLPGGQADAALRLLVSQVDRRKAGLWVSALNVDVVGDQASARGMSDSLSIFGGVVPQEGYSSLLAPGDSIAVRLSGSVASIGFDPVLAMNYATYLDEQGQTHYAYFASPANLERQLAWARQYGLGAIAVYGIAHPQAPRHIADGLTAFLSQQAIGSPEAIQLSWNVTGSSGAQLNEQSGDLSLIQYLWQAAVDPGEYVINASVLGSGQDAPISTLAVQVGQVQAAGTGTPTATPTLTVSATPPKTSGTTTVTPQPTTGPVTGVVAAGSFEIGGQVVDNMASAAKMQHAGMTWVKFQHKWSPGEGAGVVADKINAAHSAGFKILLSIPGQQPVTSIDYAGYVSFLSGVAGLGPDAIEVWNEMNFDREWPITELGGGAYTTNMLAPAYTTIKSVNPAVMVISGAPTPTGAFPAGCGYSDLANENGCNDYEYLAQMRDAGAANYADCIGIHFNSGATSPAASTGHPNDGGDHHYSWYYQPMVNLYYGTLGKPLCFTELGYASAQGMGGAPGGFPWANSVTVSDQAQWLAETAVLASHSGQVRLLIIWNVDFTGGGSDPKGMYAMIRPDGTCPACDALHSVVQP